MLCARLHALNARLRDSRTLKKNRAESCLADGLRKPCAKFSARAEAAKGRRDRAEKRLFLAEDNVPQARKLQKLLRDEYDAQGFLGRLYADLADL